MNVLEVVNLATGKTSFERGRLPKASASGCAAFDSDSGYIYYVEGVTKNKTTAGVFRIQRKPLGLGGE